MIGLIAVASFVPASSQAQGHEPAGQGSAAGPSVGDHDRWDGTFRAGVDEQSRDVVSGETMVIVAYGAVWVLLFVYVLRLAADLRSVRRETEELKRMLSEAGGDRDVPPAS